MQTQAAPSISCSLLSHSHYSSSPWRKYKYRAHPKLFLQRLRHPNLVNGPRTAILRRSPAPRPEKVPPSHQTVYKTQMPPKLPTLPLRNAPDLAQGVPKPLPVNNVRHLSLRKTRRRSRLRYQRLEMMRAQRPHQMATFPPLPPLLPDPLTGGISPVHPRPWA